MKTTKLALLTALIISQTLSSLALATPNVELMRVPDGGIQPQAVVDSKGTLHLVYFKGDPLRGDLFYVSRAAGDKSKFSAPSRINSIPGSAVAKGTIRGGQIALGGDGTLYVTWNASKAVPDFNHVICFSRLLKGKNPGFEPQRNLLRSKVEMDGGGTVAADRKGNVYVFFHAAAKDQPDATGRVYMTKSIDNGKVFSEPVAIDTPSRGACPCCSMKAMADATGNVYVLYRTADHDTNRGTTLLLSRDGGKTFSSKLIDDWQLNSCPMTMFSLAQSPEAVLAAWETAGKIGLRNLNAADSKQITVGNSAKYPVIAANGSGDLLFSWSEGCSWGNGGEVRWQVFDSTLKPSAKIEKVSLAISPWSFTAVAPQPNGDFLLIY